MTECGTFTRSYAFFFPNVPRHFEDHRPIDQITKAAAPFARPRNLNAIIDAFRATPEGNDAWVRAEGNHQRARFEALQQGKISKIKYWRMAKGLTQKELADAMKSQQSDVSRYERPSYRASRRTLEKVAKALHVPVANLL